MAGPVAKGPTRTTRLDRIMDALGIRPTQLLREVERLAEVLGRSSISRQHLLRIRQNLMTTTAEKMYIIVAAMRSLTGLHFRASDFFEVEPGAAVDAPLPGTHGRSGSAPVFSVRPISSGWRVCVSQESGSAADPFESLYTEYGLLLRVIAIRRYHVPPDDAEALVHDIFMAYLERRTSIHNARAWLIGAIKNASSNYVRKRMPEAELLPEHEETVDADAAERQEGWIRQLTVASVLARLGERCRETLRRYYLGEEPKERIAEHLATSPGNVLQLLVTCRRRAQEIFRSLAGRRE
jgi:RNA polymerase sigma factor (sigma-70 family)